MINTNSVSYAAQQAVSKLGEAIKSVKEIEKNNEKKGSENREGKRNKFSD